MNQPINATPETAFHALQERQREQGEQGNTEGACMAIREPTAGELRAIMERRLVDNTRTDEHNLAIYEALRNQSEEDAARIHVLEECNQNANAFVDAIRNGLHYMQTPSTGLFGAMMERQDVLKTLLDQIRMKAITLRTYGENTQSPVVANAIVDLTGKMAAVLLNDDSAKPEPKDSVRYYCPTCKRHVHPEDLATFEVDGEHQTLHVVHRNYGMGESIPCSMVPVEVRGIDKDPPIPSRVSMDKLAEYESRSYLEAVDVCLQRLGVRRTEGDEKTIEHCRKSGMLEEATAHYLAALARGEASSF